MPQQHTRFRRREQRWPRRPGGTGRVSGRFGWIAQRGSDHVTAGDDQSQRRIPTTPQATVDACRRDVTAHQVGLSCRDRERQRRPSVQLSLCRKRPPQQGQPPGVRAGHPLAVQARSGARSVLPVLRWFEVAREGPNPVWRDAGLGLGHDLSAPRRGSSHWVLIVCGVRGGMSFVCRSAGSCATRCTTPFRPCQPTSRRARAMARWGRTRSSSELTVAPSRMANAVT